MTILLVSCGWLITGIIIGTTIATREHADKLAEARADADMWHDEYHTTNRLFRLSCQHVFTWKRRSQAWEAAAKKWHTQARVEKEKADQQAAFLAAFGQQLLEDQ